MAEPVVAAVVVNHNQRELLLECVASLLNSDWGSLQVIVVDNGSGDGSVGALRKGHPGVCVIENRDNLGFARACNQGIKEALDGGADYLFFLNNDATVASNALRILMEFAGARRRLGGAAPYIFYHDNRELVWYGGGTVALWRGRIAHRHIRRLYRREQHHPSTTDYITGCAFLARAAAIRELGGFDTAYGLYSEDVDLSLRLRKARWELWVVPEAKAYHRVSATAGGELSPFKAYHRGRSNALLVRRYARFWELLTLAIGGVLGGVAVSVKLLVEGRAPTAVALWKGIFSGLLNTGVPPQFRLPWEEEPQGG